MQGAYHSEKKSVTPRLYEQPHELTKKLIDTRLTIETPEGADLPLVPSGMGVRIIAFMIDWLLRGLLILLIYVPFELIGKVGGGIYLIVYFLMEWFYPVLFEVWGKGKTPGKKKMGIGVVNDDGTPINFGASLIRNLLRFVDFLPFLYVCGIVTSASNRRFQRVGDLAASTMVVYDTPILQHADITVSGKQAPPSDFTTEEQRALLSFAERSSTISRERQEELAQLLSPVVGEKDTVLTIKRMAKSMVEGS